MGSRDKGHRETKKTKKTAKKSGVDTIIQPPMSVEVIKKKRREQD